MMDFRSKLRTQETDRDRRRFYEALGRSESLKERNLIVRDYAERFGYRFVEHRSMVCLPLVALAGAGSGARIPCAADELAGATEAWASLPTLRALAALPDVATYALEHDELLESAGDAA